MDSNQSPPFVSALIIVDLQEDFCPPNGSIPIPDGREIIPVVKKLLDLPFDVKIATKDWHPPSHTSFASNHPTKALNLNQIVISSPSDPSVTRQIGLWPDHCVAGTPGAELVPELDFSQIHVMIEKATDERVEMYSGFYDIWGRDSGGLAKTLREKKVTDVWVVGLAFDYCVKETAIHAAQEGYKTVIVKEGTKAVTNDWDQVEKDLHKFGVRVTTLNEGGLDKVVQAARTST
ncbi:hypothetical protein K3495_g4056 [Podosphaera aphanis]|nr:hypothetical protein K3495_g4056 [Podosphaera aphanis]